MCPCFARYGSTSSQGVGIAHFLHQGLNLTIQFLRFYPDGKGTNVVTLRVNGVTTLESAAVPISYTVNADCTGPITVLVPDGPHFDIFIAPTGDAIATIGTDSGNYVSSIDRRVSSR